MPPATIQPDEPAPPADPPPHALACMEIWGGNIAASTAVSTPGIDAWIHSQPHHQSLGGGDIHYVSLCSAGKIARFAVADVSGHGEEVSALAQRLRTLMRRHVNTPNQARFATDLNAAFAAEADAGRFATALLATYWTPTDHLIICNAGHPRPLWYRANQKRWTIMDDDPARQASDANSTGIRNLPLGIIDPTDYTQSAYPLEPGDLVLIHTDALTEAADKNGNQLGEQGLLHLLSQLDPTRPDTLIPSLLEKVRDHRAGEDPDDDVTALLLHHNAAEPPKYSLAERAAMVGRMLGITH